MVNDCPETMRHAKLWDNFIELVKFEYEILLLSDGVEIEFISNSNLIDKTGRVITLPSSDTVIDYSVVIKDINTKEEIKVDLKTVVEGE